jgi:hypothetical protein
VRVTFLGSDPWSVPSLEALAASTHEVALVVTREPRPAGRGGSLRPTAVAEAAPRVGLPLQEVATVKEGPGLEALRTSGPEVLAVVAYGEILPKEILDWEIDILKRSGVEVVCTVIIGKTLTLDQLFEEMGFAAGYLVRQFSRQYYRAADEKDYLQHRVMTFGSDLTPDVIYRRALGKLPEYAVRVKARLSEDFRQRFKESPIKRAKRSGLARNAAIALRNETKRKTDG